MNTFKKFALVLVALMLVAICAQAESTFTINSVNYSDGTLSWTVSDGWHVSYAVFVDGDRIVSVSTNSGSNNANLSAGTHTLTMSDLDGCTATTTFTVGGAAPTAAPTAEPTAEPTVAPTAEPTVAPTTAPTVAPTTAPTTAPTVAPTTAPTTAPTVAPTTAPTTAPTVAPTTAPEATKKPAASTNSDVPKTGENTTVVIGVVALMAVAAVVLASRKVIRNH